MIRAGGTDVAEGARERYWTAQDWLIGAAALVVVVAGLYYASALVVQFLLAGFIAVICWPPYYWMRKHGVPTWVAVTLLVSGLLVLLVAMAVGLATSVAQFTKELPRYQAVIQEKWQYLIEYLAGWGIHLERAQVPEAFQPENALAVIGNVLQTVSSTLSNAFVIFLVAIFVLLEAAGFPAKLAAIAGHSPRVLGEYREIVNRVRGYTSIKTAVSLLTGLAVYIWLLLWNVDYPLLWAIFAFVLNYIPAIGSLLAAIPAVLLAVVQLGVWQAGGIAVGYFVINTVLGNIVEPRWMGRSLGLSTAVVIISMVFWGAILGPVGMFLSVPLTMIAKIVLESNEETRWIAILLGPEVVDPARAKAVAAQAVEAEMDAGEDTDGDAGDAGDAGETKAT